jgi:hypothetical protein
MGRWIELYQQTKQNGTIGADAQEVFGQATSDREAKNKYGSFNSCVITIRKSSGAVIQLDGSNERQFTLTQPGTFSIKPEEGEYFTWINILDGDSAGITAGEITVRYAVAEFLEG